jgi:DNA gyrase/topoisomerase IV subunit A
MKRILCSCLLLLSISVQAQKKPLDHTVYDQWQSIKDVVLSNDGNWMSYTVAPQEGDATLYVRHLKTNQIIQIERGTQSKFTEDNAFLIAKIKPTFDETRKAKIGKKKPEEMPKDSLAILTLSNGSINKIPSVRSYQIPEFARTAKGIPVVNLLSLEKQETIKSIISVDEYTAGHYLFFVTEKGVVKRTEIKEFESIRQNGKIAISLREGDMLLDVKQTTGALFVSLASSTGKMVTFVESDVRDMGRTAAGVRGMKLAEGAKVIGVSTSSEGKYILVVTNKGFGKLTAFEEYRQTKRGAKGVNTIKASDKNGNLIALKSANGDEDLLVVTKAGVIIRISLTQVRVIARSTQGVRLIRLAEKEFVSSIAIVEPSLEEPTEEVETVELDNPVEPETPDTDEGDEDEETEA